MFFELFQLLLSDVSFFLAYITGKTSFPQPLPPDEERECLALMQQGDKGARHKLVEHNLRLVAHVAKKYVVPGCDSDDLISIGAIGLIKAVNSYKPETGTQLATYAARCIENEILMTMRANRKHRNEMALQEPIGTDQEGNDILIMDILGTEGDAVEEAVSRRLDAQRAISLIAQCLSKRERTVIEMRYGLRDGIRHPQHEVAELLGISRSYVSRIEKSAVKKLCVGLSPGERAGE